ncbi:MAG TPA: GTP cyclohydrolase, partial [Verrucomicrobiota bacterium]|nr:GTP cyclohydrolase [Verrucomicrobiota bacterium]
RRSSAAQPLPGAGHERPLHGTSLYLAQCRVETPFGRFHAHVFQDLIHKGYIIALAHGDVGAPTLYTRIHSSCVTSETLRGCDCDCVQQLEGALEIIAQRGNGILFYLMQEGRGVGYVAKARDRMLVQHSGDRMNTFEAYRLMGLKKDYRNYEDVAHVCHLLGIRSSFILLTNNPDKIAAMKAAGLKVAAAEPLEFEPSPFNLAYLTSKAASGHRLSRPAASLLARARPPERVEPFTPYALPEAQRFIYSASYYLPVKPVDGEIVLSEEEFLPAKGAIEAAMQGPEPLVADSYLIRGHRYLVRPHAGRLAARRQAAPDDPLVALLATPYWFRVHVYFDIVTSQEFVVLTYGRPEIYDLPILRLQSESLFNRFPIATLDNRQKFKRSVQHIVHYGVGALCLLYFDGRGAGFGAHATDRMLSELGVALSSDEAYRRLGVDYDSRDYDACLLLLKHHVPTPRVQMIMNSPSSLVRKSEYAAALHKHGLEVERWIFLDEHAVAE